MATNFEAQVKMTPKHKTKAMCQAVTVTAPAEHETAVPRAAPANARQTMPLNSTKTPAGNEPSFLSIDPTPESTFWYEPTKRSFDLLIGSILLVIALPVILVAAVLIRFETKGSPFFVQTRLGKGGRPFKIVKLRGMFIDARSRFPNYYDYSEKRDLNFCFHHEVDPRVTKAGKFIRRTSIDELPNLLNVVLGDMSLVGPRPEIPEVLALYGAYRDEYLSVKPGVTCWSKCTGRDRLTKEETVEFDLRYVRNRNFKSDFRILWKTFQGVVLRRDVF